MQRCRDVTCTGIAWGLADSDFVLVAVVAVLAVAMMRLFISKLSSGGVTAAPGHTLSIKELENRFLLSLFSILFISSY